MKDATVTATLLAATGTAREERYKPARFATTAEEVQLAQRLRYDVFVEEMGRGRRVDSGRDEDWLDRTCKHLIVENAAGEVVGTYRLQTWTDARKYHGLYSAGEFEMKPFEPLADKILEAGRACVKKADRNLSVLNLLWRGIGQYARETGSECLLGCSSLSSVDPAIAASAYKWFVENGHLVEEQYRTVPHASGACRLDVFSTEPLKIPKLLKAYLRIGAKVCGPPSIDSDFGTTDFLTFLKVKDIPDDVLAKFVL